MRKQLSLLGVCLMLAAFCLPSAQASAAPANPPGTLVAYYPETGHHVISHFKKFYDANGGLAIFGLPLTEMFVEDGLQVQYFQRARFEYHPELPAGQRVQLTQIGRWFTNDRAATPAFQWLGQNPDPSGQRSFFPESGHSLGGAFRGFWEGKGGLAVFGYPISEELQEANPNDGQTYTVQFFERARFELHADKVGTPDEVQLGLLGSELIAQRPAAQAQQAAVPRMVLLGKATTGFRTSAEAREQNIFRAADMFNGAVVPAGQEYSFLNSGEFSEDGGFVEGYGIVGGRMEKMVGGGLCQVSTTMYRAVANAGLQITHRVAHSYVVYFYENILGFDATVFTPDVDFRWRNDSPGPITIFTSTDAATSSVTFELWGTSDGRKTTYQGPTISNKRQPGAANWQYDPTLPRGAVRQMVHGRAGMDVSLTRIVTMPDGKVLRNENIATHYEPWADFYLYGPGVTPPRGAIIVPPSTTGA
ncbi:vanomycin resistance protein VanB [Chloroflexia bacterium SDU3-3]|nr:vanomycin resistance protein VanB [Chloroflexia bacterium SDU3-3]